MIILDSTCSSCTVFVPLTEQTPASGKATVSSVNVFYTARGQVNHMSYIRVPRGTARLGWTALRSSPMCLCYPLHWLYADSKNCNGWCVWYYYKAKHISPSENSLSFLWLSTLSVCKLLKINTMLPRTRRSLSSFKLKPTFATTSKHTWVIFSLFFDSQMLA